MRTAEKIAEYQARIRAIEGNRDLSQEAKERLKKTVEREAEGYRTQAVNEFQAAWNGIRLDYRRMSERRAEAAGKAAEKWNWDRLNYLLESVRADARISGSLAELEEKYKRASETGDTHLLRVWATIAPAVAHEKFSQMDRLKTHQFTQAAHRDLERLTYNAELEPIIQAESDLVKRALALKAETDQAVNFYDAAAVRGLFPSGSEILKAMQGIELKQTFDVENGSGYWHLDIRE